MSDKAEKKPKKDKKSKDAAGDDRVVRLSTHPAAIASVKRTRARCGLIGFVVVLLLWLDLSAYAVLYGAAVDAERMARAPGADEQSS